MAAQGTGNGQTPVYIPKEVQELDIPGMVEGATKFITHEISLNSFSRYLIAFAIAFGGIALIWLVKGVLSRWAALLLAKVDKHRVDPGMAAEAGETLTPLLYLFPLYFALDMLRFSQSVHSFISLLILILFTTRTVRFLSALASFVTDVYLRRHQQSLNSTIGKALSPIIRVLFWTVGITIILDNMGFQISSLLAGLGIVGVAVGLASQTILGDFFGYLVILMDRPFIIGDYIVAGDVSGTVESIGLKTTRVRTTGGEVMVCPNGDITRQRISNYRLMFRRSRTFTFGVAYEPPPDKVRAIPDMVRAVAGKIPSLNIDRIHFTQFGDSSLNFETQVSIGGRNLTEALDAQQELYLGMMEAFAAENIVFAYPTRTVYFGNAAPKE